MAAPEVEVTKLNLTKTFVVNWLVTNVDLSQILDFFPTVERGVGMELVYLSNFVYV